MNARTSRNSLYRCPRPAAWPWSSSTPVLPGMKHLMERIVDTDILSPRVACKNSEKLNRAVLVRSLIFSAALWILFSETWRHSLPVSFSSAWAAGCGLTLCGIPDSCWKFAISFERFSNFPIRPFPPNLFPICGNTFQNNSKDQPTSNWLAFNQLRWQYQMIIDNLMINHLITIMCVHVCILPLRPVNLGRIA